MSNRILKGFIFNCIACNRPLSDNESTRCYPDSEELRGTCNNCEAVGRDDSYYPTYSQENTEDGVTSSRHADSHSGYYYEWHD